MAKANLILHVKAKGIWWTVFKLRFLGWFLSEEQRGKIDITIEGVA